MSWQMSGVVGTFSGKKRQFGLLYAFSRCSRSKLPSELVRLWPMWVILSWIIVIVVSEDHCAGWARAYLVSVNGWWNKYLQTVDSRTIGLSYLPALNSSAMALPTSPGTGQSYSFAPRSSPHLPKLLLLLGKSIWQMGEQLGVVSSAGPLWNFPSRSCVIAALFAANHSLLNT